MTENPETALTIAEMFISAEQLITGEVEIQPGISRIPQEPKETESYKRSDDYFQTWHNTHLTW